MMIARLIHALSPDVRRCYDRKEAASYVGVSPTSFDKLVRQRIMPRPTQLLGRKVWDRKTLDRSLDQLSGIDDVEERHDLDHELAAFEAKHGYA